MSDDVDLLDVKFVSLDGAMEEIAQDMCDKHPTAERCEIHWTANVKEGVIDFHIKMHHPSHYCEHFASIPYARLTPLTEESKMSDIHDEMQGQEAGRPVMEYDNPGEGAEKDEDAGDSYLENLQDDAEGDDEDDDLEDFIETDEDGDEDPR